MAKDISVRIKLIADSLKSGLENAASKVSAFAKSAAANIAKAGVAFSAFATGLIAAGKQAVTAFTAQEDAVNNLRAALQNQGDDANALIPKFTALASAIQEQTKYEDDAVIAAMAYGRNLGINAQQMEKATVAAIGLASKYKIDLQSAMMLVGRASQGQTQMLTRYGITLDDTLTPQQKFNELLNIGANNFALAEAEAKTTGGQIAQLSNLYGDLKEDIGGAIVQTGILQKVLGFLRDKIVQLRESGKIQEWADNAKMVLESLIPVAQKVVKAFGWIRDGIARLSGFAGALAGGAGISEAWKQSADLIEQDKEKYNKAQTDKLETATDVINEVRDRQIAAIDEVSDKEKRSIKDIAREKLKAAEDLKKEEEDRLQKMADLREKIAQEDERIKEDAFRKQMDQQQKALDAANADLQKLGFGPENQAELEKEVERIKTSKSSKLSKRKQAILDAFNAQQAAKGQLDVAQKNLQQIEDNRHQARLNELKDMNVKLKGLVDKPAVDMKATEDLIAKQKKILDDIETNTAGIRDDLREALTVS